MGQGEPADNILAAYQTLGLRPGQNAAQVKQAYHVLARALHPDRNPDAQIFMARINQAYNTLNQYFKTQSPVNGDNGWLMPLTRLSRSLTSQLSSWLGADKQTGTGEHASAIELPEALSEDARWVLLGIGQDGQKLIYRVEITGNPKALALPLRRRRPCGVCQGSGNIWQQGESTACNNCGGRGYITKPGRLNVVLPEKWHSGQRLPVESSSLSIPLELELYRSNKLGGDFKAIV